MGCYDYESKYSQIVMSCYDYESKYSQIVMNSIHVSK